MNKKKTFKLLFNKKNTKIACEVEIKKIILVTPTRPGGNIELNFEVIQVYINLKKNHT